MLTSSVLLLIGDSSKNETWAKVRKWRKGKGIQKALSLVTSPNYNQGVGYDKCNDSLPREDYILATSRAFWLAHNECDDKCQAFVNLKWNREDPFLVSHVMEKICATYWEMLNRIAWIKSATFPYPLAPALDALKRAMKQLPDKPMDFAAPGDPAIGEQLLDLFAEEWLPEVSMGHFRPNTSKTKLYSGWEDLYHLTMGGIGAAAKRSPLDKEAIGTPYADKSNLSRFGQPGRQDMRCRGDVWLDQNMDWANFEALGDVVFQPYRTIQKRDDHPCPFPAEFAERCLRLANVMPGSLVLDPFGGVGNTAVAAVRLGCHAAIVDLSPAYLIEARDKVEAEAAALGQKVEVEIA